MSILRTAKFIKYFGSFTRSIAVPQPRIAVGLSQKPKQNYLEHKYFATAFPATHTQNDGKLRTLDNSIRRLDEDARRVGRISRQELEEVIEEIRTAKSATSSQSLMVIRCCGNLVPEETPEFRTKLVSNVWSMLERLGIPMDISHYNALLRVYLENEHQFSPVEFLSELERKGIEPNRVTYQRLIASYCQRGDIEGATRILEFMREKQMPISETVFNALILGHAKAGDMESARGILNVMGQAGLEPNADSYTTLLCGCASVGDAESLEKILMDCEAKDVDLGDKDFLEIVFTLAINNHDQLVDSILSRVRRSAGYNQDASNVVLRLTTRGKEDVALKVLETMTRPVKNDGQFFQSGGFFIKQLVKANRPVESILRICEDMKEKNTNSRGLLIATENALEFGHVEMALELIKAMRDNLYPIRCHYFWPIIAKKGQRQSRDVLDVLRKMAEFKVYPNSETLRDYTLPYLIKNGSQKEVSFLIQDLKDCGVSVGAAAASVAAYLLANNKIKEAADVVTSYQAVYNGTVLRFHVIKAFLHTKDVDSFAKVIHAMIQVKSPARSGEMEETEEEVIFDEREFVGRVLLDLTDKRRVAEVPLQAVLQKFFDLGLGISNSAAEQIQSRLNGSELTTEISTLLSKLVSNDLAPAQLERKQQIRIAPRNEASLKQLIKSIELKGENPNGAKRQLFSYYCMAKEVEKVEAYRKELEAEGYPFSSGMYANLIDLFISQNLLDKAFEVYSTLLQKEPDVKLDNIKTVKLATALVQSDRLQDAIDLLKHQSREEGDINKEMDKERPFHYSSTCWRLLNMVAEKGDAEGVRKLFDTLVENKFIEVANTFLGPLVKVHIVRDDLKSALDVFEWSCQNYKATPFKNDLSCKLIEKEDAVSLQRLTDLSTIVHGEINSLHDLIISFVECGRIRQARKILETPGLKVRSDKLSFAGERYQLEGLTAPLEGLIKATKDLPQVDNAPLYLQLLHSYIKVDDLDKALGLWTQMQEEDHQPSEEFLYILGNYLKSKDQPVPFAIPSFHPKSATLLDASISSGQRILRQALRSKNWNAALKAYTEYTKSGGKLRPMEVVSFLDLAMNSVSLETTAKYVEEWLVTGTPIPRAKLYFFIKSLAKSGNIEVFERIGNFLSEEQLSMTKYKNLYCNCYIEAGKVDQLLSNIEDDLKQAKTETDIQNLKKKLPTGGVMAILESHPELSSKVEELANQFFEKGIDSIVNIVWINHILKNDIPKAEKLFTKYLQSSERIMYKYLANKLKREENEEAFNYILKALKSKQNVTPEMLGYLHSSNMYIIGNKGEYQRALSYLEEALKTVPIENFNIGILNKIKAGLETANIPFPYTIPERKAGTRNMEEDASSDSDEDVKEQRQRSTPVT